MKTRVTVFRAAVAADTSQVFATSLPFSTSGTCTCIQRAVQWSGGWVGVWWPLLLYLYTVCDDLATELWEIVWGHLYSWQWCWFYLSLSRSVTQSVLKQVEQQSKIILILWYHIGVRWDFNGSFFERPLCAVQIWICSVWIQNSSSLKCMAQGVGFSREHIIYTITMLPAVATSLKRVRQETNMSF